MSVETENNYLFIHFNTPDLQEWNPSAAANLFLSEKARRDRNTTTSTENRSIAQTYFKGVFPEARKLFDPDVEQSDERSSNKYFDF